MVVRSRGFQISPLLTAAEVAFHEIERESRCNHLWTWGICGQTWQGSFSSVSKPNFARKYALESSRRDLQNTLLRTVLSAQFVVWKLLHFLQVFAKFKFLLNLTILSKFRKISSIFVPIFIRISQNLVESIKMIRYLRKNVKICEIWVRFELDTS